MKLFGEYLTEIEHRKAQGLNPKPIDCTHLMREIVSVMSDENNHNAKIAADFFIYNTLPGTTAAASEKSKFLKAIILGNAQIREISKSFAFELLSHMKGGPSIEVLLDLALGNNPEVARDAAEILKTQVFLYEADTDRLKTAFEQGHEIAREILESYAQAEFFTRLPEVPESIEVVAYVAAEGDISTDLLSPGNQAHSRSDRELHGQCMMTRPPKPRSQTSKSSIQTSRSCWSPKKAQWVSDPRECLVSTMLLYGQVKKRVPTFPLSILPPSSVARMVSHPSF